MVEIRVEWLSEQIQPNKSETPQMWYIKGGRPITNCRKYIDRVSLENIQWDKELRLTKGVHLISPVALKRDMRSGYCRGRYQLLV